MSRSWMSTTSLAIALVLLSGCLDRGAVVAPQDEVTELPPWVAAKSVARSQNPMSWTGDEHNRLVAAALADYSAKGLATRTRGEKCQWLARFMVAEMRSVRAPSQMRAVWSNTQVKASHWERATSSLGCKAEDLPQTVTTGLHQVSPGFIFAVMVEEDTVDYEPSQEALGFVAEIDGALASSQTPSQLDQALANIQAGVGDLWDAEFVYTYASIAVSSGFYWQQYVGSGPEDPWGACEPPECYATVRQSHEGVEPYTGPMLNANAWTVAVGDAACAGSHLFGGGGGAKMVVKFLSRWLAGPQVTVALTVGQAAICSAAIAMT